MSYASRRSSYIVGSLGASLQVLAGWWDVYSHLLFGPADPWWNPAHLTLYSGFMVVLLAVWRGLRTHRVQSTGVSPIPFQNLAGLKLAGAGTAVEIVAGVWNEIVHHVLLTEPKIAPAHALLTVGMLIVTFGMIIGLTIEYGMIRHEIVVVSRVTRSLTLACVVLIFSSIWLAAAGALIYIAGVLYASTLNWVNAVMLSVIAGLVLASAKRVLPRFWVAIAVGVIFNAVSYLFLVVYADESAFIPLGLIPLAVFDLLFMGLNRMMKSSFAVVASSSVLGLFFWATYFPYTVYLFPWSSSPQPATLAVFLGGLAGAILANGVYSGLASVVLRDVPR